MGNPVDEVNEAVEELEITIPKIDDHKRDTENSPEFGKLVEQQMRVLANRMGPFLSTKVKGNKQREKDLKLEIRSFLPTMLLESVEVSFSTLIDLLNLLPKLQRKVRVLVLRLQSSVKAHMQEITALRTGGSESNLDVAFYEPLLYVPDDVRKLGEAMLEFAGLRGYRPTSLPPGSELDDDESNHGVSEEELERCRSKIRELQRENEEARDMLTATQGELEDERSMMRKLEEERDALERSLAELRAEFDEYKTVTMTANSRIMEAFEEYAQEGSTWYYPPADDTPFTELELLIDQTMRSRTSMLELSEAARSAQMESDIEARIRMAVEQALGAAQEKWEADTNAKLAANAGDGGAASDAKWRLMVAEKDREIKNLENMVKELKEGQKEQVELMKKQIDAGKEQLALATKRVQDAAKRVEEQDAEIEKKDGQIVQLEDETVALGMTIVELRSEVKRLQGAIIKMQKHLSMLGEKGQEEVAAMISNIMESCGVVPEAPANRKRVWDRLYMDFFVRMERRERVRATKLISATSMHRLEQDMHPTVTSPPRYTRAPRTKPSRSPSPVNIRGRTKQPVQRDESDSGARRVLTHSDSKPCNLPQVTPAVGGTLASHLKSCSLPVIA